MHTCSVSDKVSGKGMQGRYPVYLIAEEFDADSKLFIYRDDFNGIPPDTECATGERNIITLILHADKGPEELVTVDSIAFVQEEHLGCILFRGTQAVDAGNC